MRAGGVARGGICVSGDDWSFRAPGHDDQRCSEKGNPVTGGGGFY